MAKMLLSLLLVAVICVLTLQPSDAQVQIRLPLASIAFGYVDASGTRLLTLPKEEDFNPSTLSTAICSEARESAIRFLQFQMKTERNNGRQSMQNFGNDEGLLFEFLGAPAKPDDTCMLVPSGFMKNGSPVRNDYPKSEREARAETYHKTEREPRAATPVVFPAANEFRKAAINRIEQEKRRTVKTYWLLYRAGEAQEVAMVEFHPASESLLASLVLAEPGGLSFFDLPAKRSASDCWRADDDCTLRFPQMDVPVIFRSTDGPLIFFTWWGAEGQSITLFQARDGKLIDAGHGYRYRAPN